MKKILVLCALFSVIAACSDDEPNIICLPGSLQNGVIAFYPFSRGDLDDASNFNNTLSNTTSASASSDRAGNAGCAYKFDNTGTIKEFLTASQTGFLNGLEKFSVSLWYYPEPSTRKDGDFETLISRGNTLKCPDRNGEWSIGLYDCRRAVFGHNNSVWANRVTILSSSCTDEMNSLTGRWHHVVAVKGTNSYKLYFDGNLTAETNDADCSNLQLAKDIGDLLIGSNFTGKIDDIVIYNRELSNNEAGELYKLPACCE